MRGVRAGMHEYQLQALMEWVSAAGCVAGYGSIVGAGANAVTLHYVANNAQAGPASWY